MKNANRKNTSLLISVLVVVIWVVLVITLSDFTRLGFSGWLAFLYVPVSVAVIYYCISAQNTIKNDSSTLGIPIYYSAAFLAVAVILNGSYLLLGSEGMRPIIIALDVILLAVYFILMLAAGRHIDNVNRRIEKSEEITATTTMISKELGKSLALAEDKEIHQAILSLKEKVDYAGNSRKSKEDEAILRKARELSNSLVHGDDKETVLQLVNQLGRLWAARNI